MAWEVLDEQRVQDAPRRGDREDPRDAAAA